MTILSALTRHSLPLAVVLTTASQAMAQPELPALRAVSEGSVAEGFAANMVIGVRQADGDTTWISQGSLAFGDDQAAGPDSLYRAYSLTKPVTSVAAVLLIEDGVLGLDEPIATYLPAFAEMEVLVDPNTFGDTRPATAQITIRHLLTHTAGLGYSLIPSGLSETYAEAGVVPGLRLPHPLAPTYGAEPDDLRAFADRVATLPLRVDPGVEWHYSIGHDVLAAVIEEVAGQSFETVLETRIFQPLGMEDTGFVVAPADLDRLTTNYARLNGETVVHDTPENSAWSAQPSFASGGAGLVTTPQDYLRFMSAMANGGQLDGAQVLPEAAVRLATSDLLPDGVTFDGFGAFSSTGQGFGAGGRVWTRPHGGEPEGTFGFASAASSISTAIPDNGTAMVMMTQMLFANDLNMMTDATAAFVEDVME